MAFCDAGTNLAALAQEPRQSIHQSGLSRLRPSITKCLRYRSFKNALSYLSNNHFGLWHGGSGYC